MSVEDESWDRSICDYCKSYIQYGQKGLHLNGVCLIHNPINNIEMEDLPLITGKHRNKAQEALGKVYEVSV